MTVHGNVPIDIYFTIPMTDMTNFFWNVRGFLYNVDQNLDYLRTVDFSHFDASELHKTYSMFKFCYNLVSVNFENVHAPKLEYAENMFEDCDYIEYLNFSTFYAPNLAVADKMFSQCTELKILDLSNLLLPKLVSAKNIFYYAYNLGYDFLKNFLYNPVLIEALREAAKGNLIICQPIPYVTGSFVNNFCCNYNIERNWCYSENYIIIHINQNAIYNNGFYNEYRKKVRFITTTRSFAYTKSVEIPAGTKIEISLENDIETLEHFFDSRYDENMRYVESIDFSNFNSSSLINCKNLFYGCTSLKSVNFTNF